MTQLIKNSFAIKAITLTAAVAVFATMGFATPNPTSAQQQIVIRDGDLIRAQGEADIYIVKLIGNKAFKRLILNENIFNSYAHLRWNNVKDIPAIYLNKFTTSNLVMEVNPLGNPINGKVYVLLSSPNADVGTKHHLTITASQFEAAGLDWDSIYNINQHEAHPAFYPEGPAITAENLNLIFSSYSRPTTPDTASPTINNPLIPTSEDGFLAQLLALLSEIINQPIEKIATDEDAEEETADEETATEEEAAGISFSAILKASPSNVLLEGGSRKEVARFTLSSDNGDSTLEQIELRFSPRGTSSKDARFNRTFIKVRILDGNSVLGTKSANDATRDSGDYIVSFLMNPDIVIDDGEDLNIDVEVEVLANVDEENFQEWRVGLENARVKGEYAEKSITSRGRTFEVVNEIPDAFIKLSNSIGPVSLEDALINSGNVINVKENRNSTVKIAVVSFNNESTDSENDAVIDEIAFELEGISLGSGKDLSDLIESVYLTYAGLRVGERVYIDSSNDTQKVVFEDIDVSLPASGTRSSKHVILNAEINPANQYSDSAKLRTSVKSQDVKMSFEDTGKTILNQLISGRAVSKTYKFVVAGELSSSLLSSPRNVKLSDDSTSEPVIGINLEAEQEDIEIESVKVSLTAQGNSGSYKQPWNTFDRMRLNIEGRSYEKSIRTSGAYSRSGNTYTTTFSNVDADVTSRNDVEIEVELSLKNDPNKNTSQDWVISFGAQAIKGTDRNDIARYTGNLSQEFSVGEDIGVNLSLNSDNPEATTVQADIAKKIDLLIFEIENSGDKAITINELGVKITGKDLGNDKALSDIIRSVGLYLEDEATALDTGTPGSNHAVDTLNFNQLDVEIRAGRTEVFIVKAYVRSIGNYNSGASIMAEVVKNNIEFQQGSIEGNSDYISGSAQGNKITISRPGALSATVEEMDDATLTPGQTKEVARYILASENTDNVIETITLTFTKRINNDNADPSEAFSRVRLIVDDNSRPLKTVNINSSSLNEDRELVISLSSSEKRTLTISSDQDKELSIELEARNAIDEDEAGAWALDLSLDTSELDDTVNANEAIFEVARETSELIVYSMTTEVDDEIIEINEAESTDVEVSRTGSVSGIQFVRFALMNNGNTPITVKSIPVLLQIVDEGNAPVYKVVNDVSIDMGADGERTTSWKTYTTSSSTYGSRSEDVTIDIDRPELTLEPGEHEILTVELTIRDQGSNTRLEYKEGAQVTVEVLTGDIAYEYGNSDIKEVGATRMGDDAENALENSRDLRHTLLEVSRRTIVNEIDADDKTNTNELRMSTNEYVFIPNPCYTYPVDNVSAANDLSGVEKAVNVTSSSAKHNVSCAHIDDERLDIFSYGNPETINPGTIDITANARTIVVSDTTNTFVYTEESGRNVVEKVVVGWILKKSEISKQFEIIATFESAAAGTKLTSIAWITLNDDKITTVQKVIEAIFAANNTIPTSYNTYTLN